MGVVNGQWFEDGQGESCVQSLVSDLRKVKEEDGQGEIWFQEKAIDGGGQ